MDIYLHYVPKHRVVACRQCLVAVWPKNLISHFRGPAHELTLAQAQEVVIDLNSRSLDLCWPQDLKLPKTPVQAIVSLPVFRDGQRCTLDPRNCAYVFRNKKVLREHWRKEHKWSLCQVLGGGGFAKKQRAVERLQLAVQRPVLCQRLFSAGPGSQFFEVLDDTLDNGDGQGTSGSYQIVSGAQKFHRHTYVHMTERCADLYMCG